MAEKTESTNEQKTDSGAEKKDFKSLSLSEMETELNKASEEVQSETDATDDSVDSEEESEETESTETEEVTEDEETEDQASEDASEEVVDEKSTSKDKAKSDKTDKSFDVNKAYKELQAEFTRRNQESKKRDELLSKLQAEVESLKKPAQSDAEKAIENKFAQLKKNNPKATAFLDELQQAVTEVVQSQLQEKIAPIEERVTLRTRQENVEKFDRDIESFKSSELKELEPEILAVYNSEPNFWQRVIFDNNNAFEQLLNKVILANLDKVAELKGRKKQADPVSSKKKIIEKAQVGKPSGATKEVPTKEFKKLSLAEMEAALPKAD